ncbi:MAG TPA: preprotein translocase subunit YajC [Paenibacillaceae bacterium]|nr:preprotein translocase subunit YajC [Paenibacillaceae bacterium]
MEGAWGNILIFAAFIGIFYFMILRPQQKRQKQMGQMLNALKKGDRVVTIGGLHGTIDQINEEENTIILLSGGSRLTFEKRAINNVLGENV